MKTLKKILIVISVFSFVMLFSFNNVAAQTYTISGKQVKGSAGSNAKLTCNPVKIAKTVKIVSITGSNAGFWISNGSYTVKKYWKQNDKSAVGLTLKPGTYYVYPNLKQNQSTANVTLKLK